MTNLGFLIQPLKHSRGFRYLFAGLLASRAGDAFTMVALSWLTLSIAGPAQLGILLFLGALPAMVSAPLAGALVDRVGLRVPVILDNLIRALLTGVVAALTAIGQVEVYHLYVFVLIGSCVGAVSDVGLEVAVPAVVRDEDLEEANTLISVIWDVAALVGPVAAGVIVAWLGPASALAVDAASFLVISALASQLPARASECPDSDKVASPSVEPVTSPTAPGVPPSTPIDARAPRALHGFVLLWRNRAVFVLTMVTVGVLVISGAQEVFYPVFVRETLSLDADAYGLLVSITGGFSLAGTVLLTPVFRTWRPVWALSLAVAVRGLLLLPVAGARGLPFATFWAASSTALDGPYYPLSRALCQRLVPAAERGAVTGARASFNVVGFPAGNAAGGLLLAQVSPSVFVAGLALCHLPLVALLVFARSVRRLPRPAGAAEPHEGGQRQARVAREET